MMFKFITTLNEIKQKLDDWREHVDERTENNLNAAGSSMQRIVIDEVAKLRHAHDSVINNIHTLQVRLHNIDVKLDMLLGNQPKAIETNAPKKMGRPFGSKNKQS